MEHFTLLEKLLALSWAALTVLVTWVWKIARQKADMDTKLNSVQGLQERVESMTNRVGVLETSVQRLEERLDGIDNAFGTLTTSVGNIQREQAVVAAELRNICRSLDEIKRDLRDISLARMPGGRRSYDGQANNAA